MRGNLLQFSLLSSLLSTSYSKGGHSSSSSSSAQTKEVVPVDKSNAVVLYQSSRCLSETFIRGGWYCFLWRCK